MNEPCRHTGAVRWKEDWSGIEAFSADYVRDVDHDDGTCAIYRCRLCGGEFHVELPD